MESRINRQWMVATERVRRGILADAKTRAVVAGYCKGEINEAVPRDFLSEVKTSSPALEKTIGRLGELETYLALPEVPHVAIQPDIRNSKASIGQKELVLKRAKFARDVRCLGLLGQIITIGVDVGMPGVLFAGDSVRITYDVDREGEVRNLLDPTLYTKRVQVKDRVYKITIGNRDYILKERKTPLHRDTVDLTDAYSRTFHHGLSAKNEFAVAKKLSREGKRERDNIKLSFERPIAHIRMLGQGEAGGKNRFIDDTSANYQDMFQFVIYDFEENLLKRGEIVPLLAGVIQEKNLFLDEYQRIMVTGEEYLADFKRFATSEERGNYTLQNLTLDIMHLPQGQPVDIPLFAQLKAYRMRNIAEGLYREAIAACDMRDNDGNFNAGYRVIEDGGLEMIGLDFEYYGQADGKIYTTPTMLDQASNIFRAQGELPVTRQTAAAYFALVRLE